MELFKKDTFVDDQIAILKKNAAELERWATSGPITEGEYRAKRCELINLPAIKALMGIDIKDKDSKLKPGRSHKAPTLAQAHEVAAVIDTLVNGIEKSAREAFETAKNGGTDDDDKGVPIEFRLSSGANLNLDAKAKEIRNQILGDSADSIAKSYFTCLDCQKIQMAGEKIRKAGTITTTLIIGGIVIIITAGVLAAIYFWKKKKKDREAISIDVDDGDQRDSIGAGILEQMESSSDMAACTAMREADEVPFVQSE